MRASTPPARDSSGSVLSSSASTCCLRCSNGSSMPDDGYVFAMWRVELWPKEVLEFHCQVLLQLFQLHSAVTEVVLHTVQIFCSPMPVKVSTDQLLEVTCVARRCCSGHVLANCICLIEQAICCLWQASQAVVWSGCLLTESPGACLTVFKKLRYKRSTSVRKTKALSSDIRDKAGSVHRSLRGGQMTSWNIVSLQM